MIDDIVRRLIGRFMDDNRFEPLDHTGYRLRNLRTFLLTTWRFLTLFLIRCLLRSYLFLLFHRVSPPHLLGLIRRCLAAAFSVGILLIGSIFR